MNSFVLSHGFHNSLTIQNNSFYSSKQKERWYLPNVILNLNANRLLNLYGDFFSQALVSIKYSNNTKDLPLHYSNKSDNSLLFTPQNFQKYTTNNDLFITAINALKFACGVFVFFNYYFLTETYFLQF